MTKDGGKEWADITKNVGLPKPCYVSTIEAMVHALGMLEEGDPARFQSMMNPFRAMVDLQVGFASRVSDPRWRRSRHKPKSATSRMPPISLSIITMSPGVMSIFSSISSRARTSTRMG